MDMSLWKSVRRSSFLFISVSFLLIGGVGLYLLEKVEGEESLNEQAAREIHELNQELLSGQIIMTRLRAINKAKSPTPEFRQQWNEYLPRYNERIENLFKNPSRGIFGSLNLSSALYSNQWHLDETLKHDIKLKKTLLQKVGSPNYQNFKNLFKDVERYTHRTLDQIKPFKNELLSNIKYLQQVKSIIISGISFLFLSLLASIYFIIFKPWRQSYRDLENEKLVLQDVLRESELRGNTFSWEVNYDTKVVKRSNQLHGIFEVEDESDDFLIYDEISLLKEEYQMAFSSAIDSCALKGDLLDIQVCLQAKNKKLYWFHYYARRVVQGKTTFIKGTVKDISHQKLAETRFQKIFNVYETPCLIFGEGQIRAMNQSALEFLGVHSMDELDKLHPAILFPLYQMDGNSSLDKLKSTLVEVRNGKEVSEDWSFQTRNKRDVVGRTTIIHLPYTDSELFLMIINDDTQKVDFERRLVDANRRALQARRLKLEYVTQVGIILQDLTKVLKEELKTNEGHDLGHKEKIAKIQAEVDELWQENLTQSMDETSNINLTNLDDLTESLYGRWREMAQEHNCQFSFLEPQFKERYFWLDSANLRLAMMAVVEAAIKESPEKQVSLSLNTDFKNGRHGKLRFLVQTNNPNWPGENWRKLVVGHREDREGAFNKPLSLANFFNIIEILQGETFFERNGDDSLVGFEFSVERAIGLTSEDIQRTYHGQVEGQQSFSISASDIWSHFGGDWDVIENTIKDFLDYYPSAIADLIYYLRAKNSQGLVDTATDLYGVLSHFPFFNSIERIIRIQKYSRYLKFEHVEDEIEALSYDLNLFSRALQDFLPEERRVA